MPSITFVPETPAHQLERDILIEACFSAPQPERAAYRLRDGIAEVQAYSHIALFDGQMMASVRFYPLCLPGGDQILMLGPLAVAPMMRGQGIGTSLVRHTLAMLRSDNHDGVLVIGDAGYFTGLGFSVALTRRLRLSGVVAPLTLLGMEWQQGFLSRQSGMLCRGDQ